jgi:hypothetical protein
MDPDSDSMNPDTGSDSMNPDTDADSINRDTDADSMNPDTDADSMNPDTDPDPQHCLLDNNFRARKALHIYEQISYTGPIPCANLTY